MVFYFFLWVFYAAAILLTWVVFQGGANLFSSPPPLRIAVLFAFCTALCLWGLVGTLLSRAKGVVAQNSSQRKKISARSWHYQFNKWFDPAFRSRKPTSECEYWAGTFSRLLLIAPPLFLVFEGFTVFLIAFYWLASFCPNPQWLVDPITALSRDYDFLLREKNRNRRRQWVGPTLVVLIVVSTLVLFVPSGFRYLEDVAFGAATIGIAFLFAKLFAWMGLPIYRKALRPIATFLIAAFAALFFLVVARASDKCRFIDYVE